MNITNVGSVRAEGVVVNVDDYTNSVYLDSLGPLFIGDIEPGQSVLTPVGVFGSIVASRDTLDSNACINGNKICLYL